MKKAILVAAGVLIIAVLSGLYGEKNTDKGQRPAAAYRDGTINLAGKSISMEWVDDSAKQMAGLSGRAQIEENQGMLFVFSVPHFPSFWMKDMNFPIDIVWVKGDEVVDISKNVPNEPGVADDKLKTYTSKKPADSVLELKAGWADRNGLKTGDKIEIIREVR